MAGTLSIECLTAAGAFLVDESRYGRRAFGVPAGGPADPRAAGAANALLGQPAGSPTLEITLTGGRWLLSGRGQFVLTGADITWRGNGRVLETYYVHDLDGDMLLVGGGAGAGVRTYLAVNGQWDLTPNDHFERRSGRITPGWQTTISWTREAPFRSSLNVYQHLPPANFQLPVIPGPEWGWLTLKQQQALLGAEYTVSPNSSRQGLRLNGGAPHNGLPAMISSPVLSGTLQLSPEQLLLLGPEAQTLGGYPRVLLAADPDALATAFQLRAKARLSLRLVD